MTYDGMRNVNGELSHTYLCSIVVHRYKREHRVHASTYAIFRIHVRARKTNYISRENRNNKFHMLKKQRNYCIKITNNNFIFVVRIQFLKCDSRAQYLIASRWQKQQQRPNCTCHMWFIIIHRCIHSIGLLKFIYSVCVALFWPSTSIADSAENGSHCSSARFAPTKPVEKTETFSSCVPSNFNFEIPGPDNNSCLIASLSFFLELLVRDFPSVSSVNCASFFLIL